MEYISPAAIGAGATIKLIEVSLRLTNVENETSDFIKIVSAIGTDLNEAIRLRNAHRCSLDTHSLHRTDTVILNTESAMSGVATLVEDPRVDVRERGKVGMGNKLLWTFKDSHEMNTKQAYLTTCHQSLLSVIAELKGREREERQTRAPPPYGGLPGYEEDGRDLIAALKREHSGSKKRSYGGQSQKSQQLPTPPFSPPAERLHDYQRPPPDQPRSPVSCTVPNQQYAQWDSEEGCLYRQQAAWLARRTSRSGRRGV